MRIHRKVNLLLILTCLLILVTLASLGYYFYRNGLVDSEFIYSTVKSGVVEIKATTAEVGESFGSGVIIDDEILLTNAHVVTYMVAGINKMFDNVYMRCFDMTEYETVELIKFDIQLDIAVFKIARNIKPLSIGTSEKLKAGEIVYAIGNSSNYGVGITKGIVSVPLVKIDYNERTIYAVQCDLTIASGNSGGALVDRFGKLVGITTFRTKDLTGAVNYGFAYSLPIDIIKEYIERK